MSGAEKDAPEKSMQDFLQRWSRRKLGVADAEGGAAAAREEVPQTAEPQSSAPPAETSGEPPAPFDLAKLPPIESIDAATDIRAFLAPGVPVELTRAALRRAWTSDPAIRDFVGMAENQWDFTKPETVPGFGSLPFSEEVRAMLSQLFGDSQQSGTSEAAGSAPPNETQPLNPAGHPVPIPRTVATSQAEGQRPQHVAMQTKHPDDVAVQNTSPGRAGDPVRRTHGGAMPK